MKKIVIIAALGLNFLTLLSQSSARINESNHLVFSLNNGEYEFGLGGLIQVSANRLTTNTSEPTLQLFPQRTFFNFHGKSNKNGLGFFVQTDFSMPSLLLDAVVTYQPNSSTNIEIGQRQNVGNNREMLIQEGNLLNPDRELLSTTFSKTGREFGLFIDQTISIGSIILHPQASVTSGDGLNSYGLDSRDVDLGGLKFSGRFDIYPFGSKINSRDIKLTNTGNSNQKPWAVFGVYGSFNQGASDSKGEGHNNFNLYNSAGELQLPNYRKWGVDLLFKWNKISILAEYGINTANGLKGSYIDMFGNQKLTETQISEYLALGSGYQLRLGYVLPKNFELYATYGAISEEFSQNPYSIVQSQSSWKAGLSKYNKSQNLRLHIALGTNTQTRNLNTATQLHVGAQMSL